MAKLKKKTSVANGAPKHRSKQPRWLRDARHWVKRRVIWQRWVIYFAVAIITFASVQFIVERAWSEVKNPQYGVSFSIKYSEELGLDWKETYFALLDDMQIRHLRLMSYWDSIESTKGVYDFNDLDWQFEEAAKRGAKVSLAVGMRQPRWPECHKPDWYGQLSREEQTPTILKFVETVVTRYKDHPALESYQMENEAVNTWFGTCTDKDIDRQRLRDEFAMIKSLDSDTPVYMSLSDQHGLPFGTPVPDQYGYSVYRTVWNNKTGPLKFYATYPTPVWYHRLRAMWIKTFKNRDVFIHELQLEPWGPEATVTMSVEDQNKSMNLKQIRHNVRFARKIGKPDIYTWGAEWWYWRKVVHNDPTVWDTVRQEFARP